VHVCARRSASGRFDATGGVVRLQPGSQARTSARASEQVPRDVCCRMASTRCMKQHSRSLLGACAQEVRRYSGRAPVSSGNGSAGKNQRTVRDRKRNSWTVAEERFAVRKRAQPTIAGIAETMAEEILGRLSKKSDTAMAVRYALGRGEASMRYCDDGRLEIDNNAAERSLRAVALGRSTCSLDRTAVVTVRRCSTV
jgi:hypothetical protein